MRSHEQATGRPKSALRCARQSLPFRPGMAPPEREAKRGEESGVTALCRAGRRIRV
jgi:hypothetical protein